MEAGWAFARLDGDAAARVWLALGLVGCTACATAPHGGRQLPSAHAVHEALERVTPLAEGCLRPGERVTVAGAFDGPTGRLRLERAGAAAGDTPVRTLDCVVHTLELARLPPFRAPERPVRWTVARPGPNDGDAGAPTPFARPRDPVQEATIDLPRVLAVVRAHARALRDCYETFLSAEAPIAGRVELRLTVSVEGRVLDAEARGPEALRPTMRCVEGLFAGMLLPPARGGAVDVALPFEFSPVGGAGAEPNTPR